MPVGFLGHPAFLFAVTAIIAVGVVAYEYYQHHKAQNTSYRRGRSSSSSIGRRRRRSSSRNRVVYDFEFYEDTRVQSYDTNSYENIQPDNQRIDGGPSRYYSYSNTNENIQRSATNPPTNEIRRRVYASEIKSEQRSDTDPSKSCDNNSYENIQPDNKQIDGGPSRYPYSNTNENIQRSATNPPGNEIRLSKCASAAEQRSDLSPSRSENSYMKENSLKEEYGPMTTAMELSYDLSGSSVVDQNFKVNNSLSESPTYCNPNEDLFNFKQEEKTQVAKTRHANLEGIKSSTEFILKHNISESSVQESPVTGNLNDCNADLNFQPKIKELIDGSDGPEMICCVNESVFVDEVIDKSESISENEKCREGSYDDLNLEIQSNAEENGLVRAWKQLSNSDTGEILCLCCDKNLVTTVVLPCAHKYTCKECAPMLFQHYNKCPTCRNKIVSFKSARD